MFYGFCICVYVHFYVYVCVYVFHFLASLFLKTQRKKTWGRMGVGDLGREKGNPGQNTV